MNQVIRRQDLVEADLRCLMCGRMIGRLAGLVWRDVGSPTPSGSTVRFTAFRPASADQPSVSLTGPNRFRCAHCGGIAAMEEISVRAVREQLPPGQTCPIHRDRVPRRGRRPKGCQCAELGQAA